jgi:hypothetical protein
MKVTIDKTYVEYAGSATLVTGSDSVIDGPLSSATFAATVTACADASGKIFLVEDRMMTDLSGAVPYQTLRMINTVNETVSTIARLGINNAYYGFITTNIVATNDGQNSLIAVVNNGGEYGIFKITPDPTDVNTQVIDNLSTQFLNNPNNLLGALYPGTNRLVLDGNTLYMLSGIFTNIIAVDLTTAPYPVSVVSELEITAQTTAVDSPVALFLFPNRNFIVADTGSDNVFLRVDGSGNTILAAGSGNVGTQNGPLISASFMMPLQVVKSSNNIIYSYSPAEGCIRKIVFDTILTAPTELTNLSPLGVTPYDFAVTWSGGYGAISYTYDITQGGQPAANVTVADFGTSNNSVSLSDLTPNTEYVVTITATNLTGSTQPKSITVTTTELQVPPSAISNVTSSMIISSGFTVGWSGGDGATSYTYTLNDQPATPSADDGVASKSATFSGLTAGTTYNIVVNAVKGALTSSSSSFAVTTLLEGDIMWEGGLNVTLPSITNIQKTGGVDGNEDAGQSSYPIFIGTKFLQFSVSSLLHASIGIGRNSVFKAGDYRRVNGNLTFDFAFTLISNGDIQLYNGIYNNGEGVGTYNSNTVFGIMNDISNNALVFYVDNVEVRRNQFQEFSQILNQNSSAYINVSIRTAGTAINNIKLFDEKPEFAPSQPFSLASNSLSSSGFTVGWSGGDGATSYTYTIDGAAATPSVDNGLTTKSATFDGLTAGTTYTVVVTAVNGSLSSSSPITVTTTAEETAPSAITNLSNINRTSSSFTVTWSGGDGATSYTYTLNDQPATPSTDDGVASNSATFSGLNSDTLYSVVITAVANNGLTTSSESFNCGTDGEPPSPITGLTSSSITSSGFTVGWSGGDGATSYRYILDGTEVIPSAEDGVTSTATFVGLTSETSYSIVVIAIKASSFGDLTASSDPLTVSTTADQTPPSAITYLSWDNISSNYFTITWGGGNGATSYTYTLNGEAATPSADDGVGSKSATFSGLNSSTTYSIVVTAVKASSSGNLTTSSDPLSITTT